MSVWDLLPAFRGPAAGARAIASVAKQSSGASDRHDRGVAKAIAGAEDEQMTKAIAAQSTSRTIGFRGMKMLSEVPSGLGRSFD